MHSASSLFAQNVQSADDCLQLFDGVSALQTKLQVDWVLRAAVVFAVSALDAYFHDKVKYRVGRFGASSMPPALAKFEVPLATLAGWDSATRKGNVIRNSVMAALSVRPLQSPAVIADTVRLIGISSFWDTIEPNAAKKKALLGTLNGIVKRRNQIAHEGDRMSSRKSGKRLHTIVRADVQGYVDFSKDLVTRVEAAFPG